MSMKGEAIITVGWNIPLAKSANTSDTLDSWNGVSKTIMGKYS